MMDKLVQLLDTLMSDGDIGQLAAHMALQSDPAPFTQGIDELRNSQLYTQQKTMEAMRDPAISQAPESAAPASNPIVISGGAEAPATGPKPEQDIKNTMSYGGTNPLVPTAPEEQQSEDDKLQTALQAWAMMQAGQQQYAPPRAGMPSLGSAGLAQALIPQLYAQNPAGTNQLANVQTLLNQATGGRI